MFIIKLTERNLEDAALATNRDVEELRRSLAAGNSQNKAVYVFVMSPDSWSEAAAHPNEVIPIREVLDGSH